MHATLVSGSGKQEGRKFLLMRSSSGPKWATKTVHKDRFHGLILEGELKFEPNPNIDSSNLDLMAPVWQQRPEGAKKQTKWDLIVKQ